MNNEAIFLLDFPEADELLRDVISICDSTIKIQNERGEPCPAKFGLAREAAIAMRSLQPVSLITFNGLLDSIGGYYSATIACKAKYEPNMDVSHAEKLMRFAESLQKKAAGVFGPESVKRD